MKSTLRAARSGIVLAVALGWAQVVIVVSVIAVKLKRVVDAATVEQRNRDMERTLRAIQSTKLLRHPAVFITFDTLRQDGRIPSHEEARARGELHVIDTWENLSAFVQAEATLFVSHQWQAAVLERNIWGCAHPRFDVARAGSGVRGPTPTAFR